MITYTFKIKTSPSLIQKFEEHLSITRCVYNLAKETKDYAYSRGIKLSKFEHLIINKLLLLVFKYLKRFKKLIKP